jgi:hypothetical protein
VSSTDARLALGVHEREQKRRDADHDEGVREVESGPEAQVEEVRHVADAQPVDQVPQAAADQEPESHGQDRMARPGLGEVEEHPEDGARGEERDDGGPAREEAERDPGIVHVPDVEGPNDVHGLAERKLRDDDLLRQLIRRQA